MNLEGNLESAKCTNANTWLKFNEYNKFSIMTISGIYFICSLLTGTRNAISSTQNNKKHLCHKNWQAIFNNLFSLLLFFHLFYSKLLKLEGGIFNKGNVAIPADTPINQLRCIHRAQFTLQLKQVSKTLLKTDTRCSTRVKCASINARGSQCSYIALSW